MPTHLPERLLHLHDVRTPRVVLDGHPPGRGGLARAAGDPAAVAEGGVG